MHLLRASTAIFAAVCTIASAISTTRERVTFSSSGTQLVGYHHAPTTQSGSAPVVIIAHGLGGLQSGRLQPVAERFASVGYHALTFDYRTWGESAGQPRNIIEFVKQEEDYRAAIAFAKGFQGVDPNRVVVWGTSLSGGHVLQLGATMPELKAVIAQAPHVNGPATVSALPPASLPNITATGFKDAGAAALGQSPVYIPTAAPTGQFGALTQPDAYPGYQFVQADAPPPGNVFAARFVLELPLFSPDVIAPASKVPTFIGVGQFDDITPPSAAIALAKLMGATLRQYPGGHFDVYPYASQFEAINADQIAFLKKYVPS